MNLAARSTGTITLFVAASLFIASAMVIASSLFAAPAPAAGGTSSPKSPDAPDGKPAPTPTSTDGKAPAFTAITYEVTGGFAGFQRKMTITADGKLQIRDARPPKSADGELTKDELAELAKRAAAVDWKTVQPKYVDPQVADAFNVGLTVAVGAETHKTTVTDPAPAKVPEALASLTKYLRDLRQKPEQAPAKPGK
jgi:hypothetical protein